MSVQAMLKRVNDKMNRLAHDTLHTPPDTFEKFNQAVGRYRELADIATELAKELTEGEER